MALLPRLENRKCRSRHVRSTPRSGRKRKCGLAVLPRLRKAQGRPGASALSTDVADADPIFVGWRLLVEHAGHDIDSVGEEDE